MPSRSRRACQLAVSFDRIPVTDLARLKREARVAAQHSRLALHAAVADAAGRAARHALTLIAPLPDVGTVSAYLPIRGELDPRPVMLALHELGYQICVPTVQAPRQPLAFRGWRPEIPTVRGNFGVEVPVSGEDAEPDVMLVPLLAYDGRGHRLGYGGGFYDRTIAAIRQRRPVRAFGYAYADQGLPLVPTGDRDAPLDAIVTEAGIVWPV